MYKIQPSRRGLSQVCVIGTPLRDCFHVTQVMYRRAVKKVSDLVSQFAVGHNVGTIAEAIDNIVAQMGTPCPLKVRDILNLQTYN